MSVYNMKKVEKRTYKDRAEYLKKAVTERRRKLKKMLIDYKGGKCQLCGFVGYEGVFDFHHKGDSPKSFGIAAGGFSRSLESLMKEADKCVLICANCHREVHGGVRSI